MRPGHSAGLCPQTPSLPRVLEIRGGRGGGSRHRAALSAVRNISLPSPPLSDLPPGPRKEDQRNPSPGIALKSNISKKKASMPKAGKVSARVRRSKWQRLGTADKVAGKLLLKFSMNKSGSSSMASYRSKLRLSFYDQQKCSRSING